MATLLAASMSAASGAFGGLSQSLGHLNREADHFKIITSRQKKKTPNGSSGDKLCNSIGKIGFGMHASGRSALGGGTVSPKKDIDKGPARTLSVRDAKLAMATGRRYNRMPSWERQRRLAALFNMKG